jgi:hypothetical protein
MTDAWQPRSSYGSHLPEALAFPTRDDEGPGRPLGDVLDRLLYACEALLSGHGRPDRPGIEELLDGIPGGDGRWLLGGSWRYHDPGVRSPQEHSLPAEARAPDDALPWLAAWVGATVRDDVDPGARRAVVAEAVQLHRRGGTAAGLQRVLDLHVHGTRVEEPQGWLQVGASRLGVDSHLNGPVPHFFVVHVPVPPGELAPGGSYATMRLVRELVDEHKPAHTLYTSVPTSDFLVIGVRSTLGVDMLVGPGEDRRQGGKSDG